MEHVEVAVVNWSRGCRTATHARPNRRGKVLRISMSGYAGCCPRDFFVAGDVGSRLAGCRSQEWVDGDADPG
jgi:hypothetical protein